MMATSSTKILIFLGAPGSGKGTLAQHLVDNYNCEYIPTGNLLRNEVKNNSVIGKKISDILGDGGLVSDEIVNEVVEINLKRMLANEGFVLLDGYPRTLEQAAFLDSMDDEIFKSLIKVIEIDVDKNIVLDRISKRVVCLACSGTFNSDSIGIDVSKCPRCGGVLRTRDDDKEEIVKKRLDEYEKMTFPLVKYYGERLFKISGNVAIHEVADSLDKLLFDFKIEKRR